MRYWRIRGSCWAGVGIGGELAQPSKATLLLRFLRQLLVSRDRLAVFLEALDITLDRFLDARTGFFVGAALGHQAWKRRTKGNVTTFFSRLEKYSVLVFRNWTVVGNQRQIVPSRNCTAFPLMVTRSPRSSHHSSPPRGDA
jgi:hypothetical protein